MRHHSFAFFLPLFLLAAALTGAVAGPKYVFSKFENANRKIFANGANGLDASGLVVGQASFANHEEAYLCYGDREIVDLHGLVGTTGNDSTAFAISDSRWVVGDSLTPSADLHAVLFAPPTLQDLGTLDNGGNSHAYGINVSNQVVGVSDTRTLAPSGTTYESHAFLWVQSPSFFSGTMTDLGTLGGPNSQARGINASTQIVGSSDTMGGASHAFLDQGGQMQDLGTLGGPSSSATAINDAGLIVGAADVATGAHHAFIYSGSLRDLGTLGGPNSSALALNSANQIVGTSDVAKSTQPHAFLYSGGKMTDLNAQVPSSMKGLVLTSATGINAQGQICGQGASKSDGTFGWLLTPIPTLTITSSHHVVTSRSRIVVRGKAAYGVVSVDYRVNAGPHTHYQLATGTKTWHFTAKLPPGKSIITVRVKGAGHQVIAKTITVARS